MYEASLKAVNAGECAMPTAQSEIHDQLCELTHTIEMLENVVGRFTVQLQPVTNDMLAPKEGTGCTAVPRASLSPLGETLRERKEYLGVQLLRLESLLQRLAI